MELKDGRWVDARGNSWNAELTTEDQAAKKSATLIDCRSCSDCSDCSDCRSCRSCSYCRSCSDCSSCSENPQSYVSRKIGSRNSQTRFYWLGDWTNVVCGCFRGTLDEFEAKVIATHHGTGTTHEADYLALIATVRGLMAEAAR